MSLTQRLLARLRRLASRLADVDRSQCFDAQHEALLKAHGDWLVLLATILERENVISGEGIARLLTDSGEVTVVDRPAEGRILVRWASIMQSAWETSRKIPSLH